MDFNEDYFQSNDSATERTQSNVTLASLSHDDKLPSASPHVDTSAAVLPRLELSNLGKNNTSVIGAFKPGAGRNGR